MSQRIISLLALLLLLFWSSDVLSSEKPNIIFVLADDMSYDSVSAFNPQIDLASGAVVADYPAGWGHCFPPVATKHFLFSGEMDLVNLNSGELDANQITKGSCGRDAGWIPANGLIYVASKHCTCWPMLRGYAALAPERSKPITYDLRAADYLLEHGEASVQETETTDAERPCYRGNAWRSNATTAAPGDKLTTTWETALAVWPDPTEAGPIREDWIENPFVRGPVTAPVIAGGRVVVACPDAHRIVVLDAVSGNICWSKTVNGRVDAPPTLYKGRCLFGTSSGWLYCLRLSDGKLIWRLRAAPIEERIVAYGQLESPWPIAGSPIIIDDVLYFAAGRQALADGGVSVFAVDPIKGNVQWVETINDLPMDNFYTNVGLEFDNIDLLSREGDTVAMSRWVFDRQTGAVRCKADDAFALLQMGDNEGVVIPRGSWSYSPRNQPRVDPDSIPQRPLVAYQGSTIWGSSENKRTLYCRDFTKDDRTDFDLT